MLENIYAMPKYIGTDFNMDKGKENKHSFSEIGHLAFLDNSVEPEYLGKIMLKGKP